ncbi:MAG: bifunctional adenosylcobinamide kinase/adenosylcobinamide-phosphate guanylyltransferase [Candidatus Dormibacteraeota bacterium]|nr:bifunctional adenosylcobinamide kinase/adenosylcobinamide-phosphate guanylyltransferase [Candidatus Dormibacteraeota bacterium]
MLTLVLGGVKAGKSGFARRLAEQTGRPVTVLATGVVGDEEMRRRVEAHRGERPPDWRLVEEPLAIARAAGPEAEVIVLDSVDSWLFNLMEERGGAEAEFTPDLERELVDSSDQSLEQLASGRHVIAVSAEVGLSLIATSAYGRAFTDLLGMLNQRLAAWADQCYLVVSGIPVPLHTFRRR